VALRERVNSNRPHTMKRYLQCTGGHVSEQGETRSVPGGYEWLCGKCQTWNLVHTNHAVQFVPFWHEHLGHEPVYIDSWKTYRRELEKIGAHNVLAS
jgi:hypothetical protein